MPLYELTLHGVITRQFITERRTGWPDGAKTTQNNSGSAPAGMVVNNLKEIKEIKQNYLQPPITRGTQCMFSPTGIYGGIYCVFLEAARRTTRDA